MGRRPAATVTALAAVLLGVLGVVTSAPAATARPAAPRADRCLSRAAIPVRALRRTARAGCPLAGRTVVDGRVAVEVPPPGLTVAGEGVGRRGEVAGLTVANTGTTVTAVRSGSAGGGGGWYLAPLVTSPAATSGFAPPVTDARAVLTACRDRAYRLEHHRWTGPLRYRLNLRRMPARFDAATVTRQVRRANANMRLGRNTCGRPRLRTPPARFLGRTRARPDISASGPTCGRADTSNVVGFGNLPSTLLGWTCYWYYSSGRMAGADILIDDGPYLATRLRGGCRDRWDLEGTVTHEWGHAYGMAHVGPDHPDLTMQHALRPCSTYARTLGLGDWLGMSRMYGHL